MPLAGRYGCGFMELPGIMWLCTIASISGSTVRRRETKSTSKETAGFIGWLEGREPAPADVLQSAELAAKVRTVLTELPIDYETVLTAKYLDGASVEQIAGFQQCSVTAVRSRLARARQAFRQVFLKTYNDPDTGQTGGRYES